ncbi:Acetyltransferase (GNAT) domain-containing protein [Chryseobacterium soldanellicola]|uniref:Acetyltransferase (GNAT) domain-containing protein n=1 Tax=Chryseobacterium soldanellicola TaxID=311333 RepID=A0A1H1A934_9FLAO|nr:GNAT family N-acetyltransferase [Chryseobacterium soldanellicola]SDQ35826.1 Acetyltransferase (GNAT) domain-containing protein [Chryseobacterium soldanellicola]
MIIRKATRADIPFLINGILSIENTGNSNTFSNIFETDNQTTYNYLEQFFLDEENFDTEFSLNTYTIAEIDNEPAGMCALIFTDSNYYQNKGELFPIHLKTEHLNSFIKNAKILPDIRSFQENKKFLEYLFVDDRFRGKGVADEIINHLAAEAKKTDNKLYLDVLESSPFLFKFYAKFNFEPTETFNIDTPENKIYPCIQKTLLCKNLEN